MSLKEALCLFVLAVDSQYSFGLWWSSWQTPTEMSRAGSGPINGRSDPILAKRLIGSTSRDAAPMPTFYILHVPLSRLSSRRALSMFIAAAFLSTLPLFSSTVFFLSLLLSLASIFSSLFFSWSRFFLISCFLANLNFFSISNLKKKLF